MARRHILQMPDPMLRRKAAAVTAFDAGLARLADDMVQTMCAAGGIGLAAPQIGVSQRVAVAERAMAGDEPYILVNPIIIHRSGKLLAREACLSIPNRVARVLRAAKIRVRALDIKGRPFEVAVEGETSWVIQHEIDHLDGVLFIDHLR